MDHATKARSAGVDGSHAESGALVSVDEAPQRAASQGLDHEFDALLKYLVERAHDAVDRLAERAAPALGQFTENLVETAERMGLTDDPDDSDAAPEPGERGRASGIGPRLTRQSLTVVRQHPLAFLAVAVVAGVVIRQIRTR